MVGFQAVCRRCEPGITLILPGQSFFWMDMPCRVPQSVAEDGKVTAVVLDIHVYREMLQRLENPDDWTKYAAAEAISIDGDGGSSILQLGTPKARGEHLPGGRT